MPPDYFTEPPPESQTASVNFNDTELTLRMPGEPRPPKLGRSNIIDLNLRRGGAELESESSSARAPPSAKADVAGWPPVRSYRKKALGSRRYVKVAIDGAPYLRKVDLEAYGNYQELLRALEEMSTCFFNHVYSDGESKPEDLRKDTEYLPTYEDKDGDWMLVGDVPWKMFKDSCQRIRVMRSSGSPQIDS